MCAPAVVDAELSPTPPKGLGGARVGLLEGRMGSELSDLVRRHHGVPFVAAAVRELPLDAAAQVEELVDGLWSGVIDMVLFLTGAGVATLFQEAERIGRSRELAEGLRWATTVCRGQKPRAALRQRGLPVAVTVAEPYTTTDVIETLSALSPRDRGVAVVHYGERNSSITQALERWGGRVLDLCVYEWALPDDTGPIEELIERVIDGEMDAVAFTSQVQVRHLFLVAGRVGRALGLMQALNTRTVVAAVGPTCAEALRAAGVPPRVVPTNPKMGPMVVALAEYMRARPWQLCIPRD